MNEFSACSTPRRHKTIMASSAFVVFLLMLHSVVGYSELDQLLGNRLGTEGVGKTVGMTPNPIVGIGFFTERLNHLAVHRDTGELYVGATNRIYQLSPDLEKKSSTITGPKVDSPVCTLTECPANVTYDVVDNVNKVLLVHYKAGSLVSCGSVYQGSCTIRSLSNVNTVVQNVREAVAANTAGDSTVSFIGPGSPYSALGTEVMYVATTFTGNSPIRNTIPAIASRTLNPKSMLKVAGFTARQKSQIFINAYVRNSYRVQYVFGFSHKGYAYFISTQPIYNSETLPPQFGSKLVRIAQDNIGYESYTELPIECEGRDGVKYNLAQAAYFGKATQDLLDLVEATIDPNVLYVTFSVGKNSREATNHSALCTYSFVTIQKQFLLNSRRCLESKDPRGANFMTSLAVCEPSKLDESSEDICGGTVSNGLATAPVLTFQTRVTAVAVSVGSGFTVAFLGTHLGHLKKVVIESSTSAVEYADLVIDENSPVLGDMPFDRSELHVHVMTQHRLSKVLVHGCRANQPCSECFNPRDPYCGFCFLDNSCSVRAKCQDQVNNVRDSRFWVSYRSAKCPSVKRADPTQLQVPYDRNQQIELTVENIPPFGQFDLLCLYAAPSLNISYVLEAKRGPSQIICPTPGDFFLPVIAPGEHSVTGTVSLRTSIGQKFLPTDITFYDCSTFATCRECVSANFPCDWCIESQICSHNTSASCGTNVLVINQNRIGPLYHSGPDYCPSSEKNFV